MSELRTDGLLLRPWKPSDLEPFAALNADPEVMEFFPAPLTRQESDALAHRIQSDIETRGWGLWAAERLDDGRFIGFVGLSVPSFETPFGATVEIGWRLGREHWGLGFATEAARAALAYGFDDLGLEEIVAFTAVINERSRHVMERLGMTYDSADDFDHPLVAPGVLRRHVLYRLGR